MILLENLIGLKLSAINKALDLYMLQFGNLRERKTRNGKIARVGEFALHIQCPWTITPGCSIEEIVAKELAVVSTKLNENLLKISMTSDYTIEINANKTARGEQWRLFEPGPPLPLSKDCIIFGK